mmetsp:Transcript_278/g.614  ORF Transcript_278/g.614 Transcript_278/m.614 type:complete len:258 (-) Transcript_278:177-950(-)
MMQVPLLSNRILGRGQHRNPMPGGCPMNHDLAYIRPVGCSNFQECGIIDYWVLGVALVVVPLGSEARIGLVEYPIVLNELSHSLVLVKGIHPVLDNVRFDFLRKQFIQQVWRRNIANPNRLGDNSSFVEFFEGLPRILPGSFRNLCAGALPTSRFVNQNGIDVFHSVALQRRPKGSLSGLVSEIFGVDLGLDKDRFVWVFLSEFLDRVSDLVFVVSPIVAHGGIYETISNRKSIRNMLSANAASTAKPDQRDGDTVV